MGARRDGARPDRDGVGAQHDRRPQHGQGREPRVAVAHEAGDVDQHPRAAAVAPHHRGAGLEPGGGQALRQPGAALLGRHLQPQQRAVGAARVGRHGGHQQGLHVGGAVRPRRPERQPRDDVDARIVLVQQRGPPSAGRALPLGRQRQHGGGGGARAELPDRLRRRAIHAQGGERAELLAGCGGVAAGRVGVAHGDGVGRLQRGHAVDQLAPQQHQRAAWKGARMAGKQAAQDGGLPPRPQLHAPFRGQPADALHDRRAMHHQVVQGVVNPVELEPQGGEVGRNAGLRDAWHRKGINPGAAAGKPGAAETQHRCCPPHPAAALGAGCCRCDARAPYILPWITRSRHSRTSTRVSPRRSRWIAASRCPASTSPTTPMAR